MNDGRIQLPRERKFSLTVLTGFLVLTSSRIQGLFLHAELCLQAGSPCLSLGGRGDGATEPRRAPPGLGTRGAGVAGGHGFRERHRAPSLNPSDLNLSTYRVSLVTNCPYLKCVSVCLPPFFFPFLSPLS